MRDGEGEGFGDVGGGGGDFAQLHEFGLQEDAVAVEEFAGILALPFFPGFVASLPASPEVMKNSMVDKRAPMAGRGGRRGLRRGR